MIQKDYWSPERYRDRIKWFQDDINFMVKCKNIHKKEFKMDYPHEDVLQNMRDGLKIHRMLYKIKRREK